MDTLLAQAETNGTILGLLYADIDGMKPFNDRHGHPNGDELLRGLARVVETLLPKGAIAARYGGDEFMLAVSAVEEGEIVTLAEAIRQAAKGVVVAGDSVTLTLGLAFSPRHGVSLDGLLRCADEALDQGKQGGKDRVTLGPVGGPW